ncbi:hypothetical protein AOLI_G00325480 [Acnodon oligacanthus]
MNVLLLREEKHEPLTSFFTETVGEVTGSRAESVQWLGTESCLKLGADCTTGAAARGESVGGGSACSGWSRLVPPGWAREAPRGINERAALRYATARTSPGAFHARSRAPSRSACLSPRVRAPERRRGPRALDSALPVSRAPRETMAGDGTDQRALQYEQTLVSRTVCLSVCLSVYLTD